MSDPTHTPKKYIRLEFAVHFLCYKRPRATYEALKSLYGYYPKVKVHLVSDAGDDFSALARHFKCDYTYEHRNIHAPGRRDPFEYVRRIFDSCNRYSAPWIVLMEDDVRVRDKISKHPDAHIAGPSGPAFSGKAQAYLRGKYPELEINGYNGCGGCIFSRKGFLKAYESISEIAVLPRDLDSRIHHHADALLSFMFLNAGMLSRRWLDHSEDSGTHRGPGSAFDHQFKHFYNQPMVEL